MTRVDDVQELAWRAEDFRLGNRRQAYLLAAALGLQALLAAYCVNLVQPYERHEISWVYLQMLSGNHLMDLVLSGLPICLFVAAGGALMHRLLRQPAAPRFELMLWNLYGVAFVVMGTQFNTPYSYFFGARSLVGLLPLLLVFGVWRMFHCRSWPQWLHFAAATLAVWGPLLAAYGLDLWSTSLRHLYD